MSYPQSFPYEILQASPDDSKQKLLEHWTTICNEHPELNDEATRAYDELSKASSRLGYDILLIAGVPGSQAVDQLVAALAQPRYLAGELPRMPFSPALTSAVDDQSHLFSSLSLAEVEITVLQGYDAPGAGALPIHFDR